MQTPPIQPKKLLFLCTGNYYRSRFAEEYFNHFAHHKKLNWQADSRGLSKNVHLMRNPGPMSPYALQHLKKKGITPRQANRLPRTCLESHLLEPDKRIALYRSEHEPMVKKRFPKHVNLFEFWDIADIDEVLPTHALTLLAEKLNGLIKRLILFEKTHPTKGIRTSVA